MGKITILVCLAYSGLGLTFYLQRLNGTIPYKEKNTLEEVQAVKDKIYEFWHSRDIDSIMQQFTQDAILDSIDGKVAKGKEAIKKQTQLLMDNVPLMDLRVEEAVQISPNYLYLRGINKGYNTEGILIWHYSVMALMRKENGHWLIHRQMLAEIQLAENN